MNRKYRRLSRMSMITLLVMILVAAEQRPVHLNRKRTALAYQHWKAFKKLYNLKFDRMENSMRKDIFVSNFLKIYAHNNKNLGFKMEMNEFGHLTNEEFKNLYLSPIKWKSMPAIKNVTQTKSIPSVDWRNKNVVNPIRYQNYCSSSYAFSAVSSVESAFAIKTGKLLDLSEQDVVDCSYVFGTDGCNSGMVHSSFEYILKFGITSEKDYPYTGIDSHLCYHGDCFPAVNIERYVNIEAGNENALTEAVSTVSPVSATIVASTHSFRFYKSGIYYEPLCKNKNLNLGVVIVGVTDDYYIVRNSWGPNWGNDGYIYMARNKDNNCGIASAASYPVV